ncbi:MAG: sulfurtransferase TusA family protein [Clostridiaceae bacterium]
MDIIDARGLLCPEPVVLVQKAIKSDPAEATVLVDAVAAKENVTRFAVSRGYNVAVSEQNGEFTLTLKKK